MKGAAANFLDEKKSLACVHCGLCLSACPTFLETGNENDSPRGRIYLMRALQDGRSMLGQATVRHIDLCLGCRACEAACPSGVQYGELLESAREHIESRYRRGFFQILLRRLFIERVIPHRARMKLVLLPAMILRALRAEKLLPRFVREPLSLIPGNAREGRLAEVTAASGVATARVGFIRGCVMNLLFGETNEASVRLLAERGCDVVVPKKQGCCGALFAHGGNLEKARECARQNIMAFEEHSLDAIIINAAGCGSTLKEYGHLLRHDPDWAARAEAFSDKVRDLTEWLVVKPPRKQVSGDFGKVTYHDACHLAHAQRVTKQPRDLVKSVAGDNFVELTESDVCCGSAGSYNLTEPGMAERLQRRKVEHILKSGASLVVTTNPGCILQIRAGLKKAGAEQIQVVHIADVLSQES